ncbi:MAG: NUMOD4 motif-containing HNH endonuclease [Betaproteobacteria bacterium]|nr:NUMOD4 motif-containing HNH endonuclease [Betaproteobacteria bacterium]
MQAREVAISDVEQWAPVRGFEGRYEVSTFGQVRSLLVRSRVKRARSDGEHHHLHTRRGSNGYQRVRLTDSKGGQANYYVHRLVLESFIGPSPIGFECRHLDGNRGNPKLTNLQWGSHKENYKDSVCHGTSARGERQGFAKLTDAVVTEIRRAYAAREASQGKLAAIHHVSKGTIGFILRRETWKHLPYQALPTVQGQVAA